MKYYKRKIFNVNEQMLGIKTKFPRFDVKIVEGVLFAYGSIQPTDRSISYDVKIRYTVKNQPEVFVLKPELRRNDKDENIPHMYLQKKLCLHRPKYKEFTNSDLISDTIIPWTSLWLYHYEAWHITGDWQGGGEHPE